ncbi:MAG: Trm112 family protein [Gammaproteobacteria bacterium]|jgi:uncharacterized protein YbaR (Trm112 family)
MNKSLLQILVCPVCKGKLRYNKKSAELECDHDQLAFPVRNGVPVLLVMDARHLSTTNK